MPKRSASGKNSDVKPKKAKPAKSNHKLPDPLPQGEILRDILKRQWRIGPPIGSGGFGLIYLASQDITKPVSQTAEHVVKCEPHTNGPLFCEVHFYQRVAKPELISKWKEEKKLKSLGVPEYIGSGSHQLGNTKYRFMVMERFSTDLQKHFVESNRSFPQKTVAMLAIRILNALEYIHSKDYVHADIKASNLLLGFSKATSNQVFVVDYGLATKYIIDSKHREYKEDPKKAHDGTIEFTSRDAHNGVSPSRRGDLEILGYCLLQWLCRNLPWEINLNDKEWVGKQKKRYMSDIPSLMKDCFKEKIPPVEIVEYLKMVAKLSYEETPNYNRLRGIFESALKKNGWKDDGDFDFGGSGAQGDISKKGQRGKKRKSDGAASSSPKKSRKSMNDSPAAGKGRRKANTPKLSVTPKAGWSNKVKSTPTSGKKLAAKSQEGNKQKSDGAASSSSKKSRKSMYDSPAAGKGPRESKTRKLPVTPKAGPSNKAKSTPTSGKKVAAKSPVSSPRHKRLNIPKNIRGPPKGSPKESAIKKKVKQLKSEAATQTSPGLKGLERSRKK